MLENFWINPCDPVVYHWSKDWLLHVHILHSIYPYVESSGQDMQRSVVKWALFTFIPRHSQWRERIPTFIDVLIALSVRLCSQFKVRKQSDPFKRVALFRRQPRTCERAEYRRHLNSHWYVYKNIVWNIPWRLIKKNVWNYYSRFIYCRRLVTCTVQFICSVTKSDICHDIFAALVNYKCIANYAPINIFPRGSGVGGEGVGGGGKRDYPSNWTIWKFWGL